MARAAETVQVTVAMVRTTITVFLRVSVLRHDPIDRLVHRCLHREGDVGNDAHDEE